MKSSDPYVKPVDRLNILCAVFHVLFYFISQSHRVNLVPFM